MERFDHEKNQHIDLEEAGQNENVASLPGAVTETVAKGQVYKVGPRFYAIASQFTLTVNVIGSQ